MEPVAIRSAVGSDVDRIAVINRLARAVAMPWLPVLHSAEEDRAFFGALVGRADIHVLVAVGAPDEPAVVGFVAYRTSFIDQLYVDPDHFGRGIGSALLAEAIRGAGATVRLWTFRRNRRARSFYEARGFVPERTTEGDNEEREPDILYRLSRP